MEGRLAEAAMANANDTRKATFCSLATMPPRMATTPMTTDVMRATRTSLAGSALPSLSTLL